MQRRRFNDRVLTAVASAHERLARHHGSMPPKLAMPKVACTKPGCTGSCPLHVVVRGAAADGVAAKCFECNRPYRVPAGGYELLKATYDMDKGSRQSKWSGKGKAKGGSEVGQLAQKEKENADLRKKLAAAEEAYEKAKLSTEGAAACEDMEKR